MGIKEEVFGEIFFAPLIPGEPVEVHGKPEKK